MDARALVAGFREDGFDKIKLAGFDIDGILRGKYVSMEKFESALNSGFGFCDVIFGWDSADALYEETDVTVTGWHSGFPDTQARIDLDSLRRIPWEGGQPLYLIDFEAPDGSPLEVSPRQLLKKINDRATGMGFDAQFSLEFEFWMFKETPQSVRDKGYKQMVPLTPGMFGYSILRTGANNELFTEIFSQMKAFGIPIEGLHTETGPGVLEVAIEYDQILKSADRGSLFKTGMKEIAVRNGLMATFMAKWSADLPGSSGHMHQSLWRDGKPAFYDADDALGMSDTFKHYVAGILETMPEFAALYAPTINSYRRLVPGAWAPTRACWAPENRTGSLRTIHTPKPSSSRLELRVTGADINPHIACAAALAAGLWGIENKVPLRPPVKGNAYTLPESEAPALPTTLAQASNRLRHSKIAREILGDGFVDHYCATRDWEARQAAVAVTDWELDRYFEII
ncbi:MAG: glutamine synthetase [Myxococcota bacterium]|jgi:glutamine synthetase